MPAGNLTLPQDSICHINLTLFNSTSPILLVTAPFTCAQSIILLLSSFIFKLHWVQIWIQIKQVWQNPKRFCSLLLGRRTLNTLLIPLPFPFSPSRGHTWHPYLGSYLTRQPATMLTWWTHIGSYEKVNSKSKDKTSPTHLHLSFQHHVMELKKSLCYFC